MKLGVRNFFFSKSEQLRGFLDFKTMREKNLWASRCSFCVKISNFWFEVPSLARSVPKDLKVPSLARSVPKPLKVPSLVRSVRKPCVREAGVLQTRHYHRCRPPTSWLWKWSGVSEVMVFWAFIFPETNVCYRVYFSLICFVGKKVQKYFLMGLKVWWSWMSGFFFSKLQQVGRFLDFRTKL